MREPGGVGPASLDATFSAAASHAVNGVADDQLCITTLRMLAVDMIEAANSGHPGVALGAAPMAWTLWSRVLRHDGSAPDWPDRDRFVLSAGHGSAMLYALLHLFGYDVTVTDLRQFRQLGSRTPGHPERGHTPGVEVTTGPLGQGVAHAVGLALAERMAAARCNVEAHPPVVDHRTFVICGDGDLMEGVSGEASSLAGHLGLERLVVLWDDNRITIDGSTDLAFGEDVCGRYRAYGWAVRDGVDGADPDAIEAAVAAVLAEPGRPGFVQVQTTIGEGAPTKAGTAGVHGAPLGAAEVTAYRRSLDWPEETFWVPEAVQRRTAELRRKGADARGRWETVEASWREAHPDRAARWGRLVAGADGREGNPAASVARFEPGTSIATRSAHGKVLAALHDAAPELVGGSADLAESTSTQLPGPVSRSDFSGSHVHFGIREHAMAAVLNGLVLHGGFRAVGSTFLVFADYARPALRLAALMGVPAVHAYTHDSIGLGEDGPTHQPVEHLASMRVMPNVAVLRPADANETIDAWHAALGRTDGPTVLALSRQALPVLPPAPERDWISRVGARAVRDAAGAELVLVATGSEVSLALAASDALARRGIAASVVSMPWRERFVALDAVQREAVLPPGLPVVVVEAGSDAGWHQVGDVAETVCVTTFGASGKGAAVQEAFGFTPDAIADVAAGVRPGARRGDGA